MRGSQFNLDRTVRGVALEADWQMIVYRLMSDLTSPSVDFCCYFLGCCWPVADLAILIAV
jgi:hypothetical protein